KKHLRHTNRKAKESSSSKVCIRRDNTVTMFELIPDDILMEFCRYLNLKDRRSVALTCKRLATAEREAGWRIIGELKLALRATAPFNHRKSVLPCNSSSG
ncbi:hypothetical protein PFISCL1PPCAC_11795, partial [Pristionchus fissidentatus]